MSAHFLTRYSYADGAVQLEFNLPSLTEQHHKDDCDVNIILNRYMKTGVLPTSQKTPVFGDFSATPQDYASAVQLLDDARERFASLPSSVRERFGNDPLELLQFLDDPENAREAVQLGLLKGHSVGEATAVTPEQSANGESNREAGTPGGGEA